MQACLLTSFFLSLLYSIIIFFGKGGQKTTTLQYYWLPCGSELLAALNPVSFHTQGANEVRHYPRRLPGPKHTFPSFNFFFYYMSMQMGRGGGISDGEKIKSCHLFYPGRCRLVPLSLSTYRHAAKGFISCNPLSFSLSHSLYPNPKNKQTYKKSTMHARVATLSTEEGGHTCAYSIICHCCSI